MEEVSYNNLSQDRFQLLLNRADNNLLTLITRAAKDSSLRADCLLPEFDQTWELKWSTLNNVTREQPLLPQPNIPAFYRVAGIYLYYFGTAKKGNMAYLTMAAKDPYNSFHALRALADQCTAMLSEGKENVDVVKDPLKVIKKAHYYAAQAAKVHHAPGYLLLADVNFWSAQFLQSYHKDINAATAYYEMGLKNLFVANALVPHCGAAMQNAYFGQGIPASNQWGFDSVEALMLNLQTFCRQGQIQVVAERAREPAGRESQLIIDQFYASSTSVSPMETDEDEEMVSLNL